MPLDRIPALARLSVLRACGFAALAIVLTMAGTAHDPFQSFRIGAALTLVLALVLKYRADTYHRKSRIEESEVWIMLAPEERPTKDVARQMITKAMRAELREKALGAAACALLLTGVAVLLRLVF